MLSQMQDLITPIVDNQTTNLTDVSNITIENLDAVRLATYKYSQMTPKLMKSQNLFGKFSKTSTRLSSDMPHLFMSKPSLSQLLPKSLPESSIDCPSFGLDVQLFEEDEHREHILSQNRPGIPSTNLKFDSKTLDSPNSLNKKTINSEGRQFQTEEINKEQTINDLMKEDLTSSIVMDYPSFKRMAKSDQSICTATKSILYKGHNGSRTRGNSNNRDRSLSNKKVHFAPNMMMLVYNRDK